MSNVRSMNINKVIRDNNSAKSEKKEALRIIRNKAYELYKFDHIEDDDKIKVETLKFAKISIENGIVTADEVAEVIASVISLKNKEESTPIPGRNK